MLTAANSKHDLPFYPRLQPASRHDAVSFVVSSVEFSQRFTLIMLDKMMLDAAHDVAAIYELLQHQGVKPFIDLNKHEPLFPTWASDCYDLMRNYKHTKRKKRQSLENDYLSSE
ncbi:hypothetical protein [Paenibacillus sp. Leaf72]|uniref:hypothetical protein n=1 Tax=Paenibacillus sp. Leaf72 TaxID=1736234 RepID=UPI0006F77F13|nr:hypothetical protein [Paenibacillus sp. Leaf72]KQN99914.1 hypothetical protein ASF12_17155 [Paenibacillus sp. Leaf72]